MSSAVENKQDVFRRIQKHGGKIRSFGIVRLGLFGSFLRGEQHKDSDVDVLVQFAEGRKSFDNFMELALLLEDVLQRRVELVTVESLSPYLGQQILEKSQEIPLR